MRTIFGDHPRFIQTYFSTFPGRYFTGDGSRRDEDGYYWITGRVDDVINVSGLDSLDSRRTADKRLRMGEGNYGANNHSGFFNREVWDTEVY